jgi:hypothetical protein
MTARDKSQQLLAGLAMAGQVAFNQPMIATSNSTDNQVVDEKSRQVALDILQQEHQEIMAKLSAYVNAPAGHLERETELYLEQQLSEMLGFKVRAELDGHRLNHSIGVMGAEQHLLRFPGDQLAEHDAYREAGIAPKRGAFGWFTENGQLTPDSILKEKYYVAAQLMYLPNWNQDHQELKPWYKFRKMIVINPAEQTAVVAVVADAGPAMWVKKQFGGSPEVIREGKVWSPKSKGKVLLFFVDDNENQIPLGPISLELNSTKLIANSLGTDQKNYD